MIQDNELINSLTEKKDLLLKAYLPTDVYQKVRHFDGVISTLLSAGATPSTNEIRTTVNETPIEKLKRMGIKGGVALCIKNSGRFITSRQIADQMYPAFPDKEEDRFRIQVSQVVSIFGREGKLVKYQYGAGARDAAWGIKSWMGADGKPLVGKEPLIEVATNAGEFEFD